MTSENLSPDEIKNKKMDNVSEEDSTVVKDIKSSNGNNDDEKGGIESDFGPKGSLIGLSGAWAKYLVRRHWIMSLTAMFGLFLLIHLPVILNLGGKNFAAQYATDVVNSTNIGVSLLIYYLSIATSALVFDYLHAQGSATIVHSLPVTRGRLFRTSIVIGYLFMLVPLILSAVLMVVLSSAQSVYGIVDALKWLIDQTVLLTFSFAVANLAGVIAGAAWSHILLALVFEGLTNVIAIMISLYMTTFIYGTVDTSFPFMDDLTPSGHYMIRDNSLTFDELGYVAAYIGVAIILTIIAGLLYKRVKLERERSTTVFPLVGDILVIIFSFLAMSVIAIIALGVAMNEISYPTDENKNVFLITAAIAGIMSFILFRVIADGTSKIFNFKNLIKFAVFALISAAIFGVTVFDAFGIEQNVPDASNVKRVKISVGDILDRHYDDDVNLNEARSITLVSDESTKAVTELHKKLTDTKNKLKKQNSEYEDDGTTINISYTLDNGKVLRREYVVGSSLLGKNIRNALNKVIKSDEFIESYTNIITKEIRNAELVQINGTTEVYKVSQDQWEALMGNYIADLANNGIRNKLAYYREYDSGDHAFAKTGVACIYVEKNEFLSTIYIVGPTDKNTMRFLKQTNYYKRLKKNDTVDME